MAYLPGNVSRIKVKAVGDLAQESDGQRSAVDDALLKSATEELEKSEKYYYSHIIYANNCSVEIQ